jgi:hypothetical protein
VSALTVVILLAQAGSAGGGEVDPLQKAWTAAIIGASRAEQLDDLLVAVEKPLAADLKARLDELTLEYRWGDDPR